MSVTINYNPTNQNWIRAEDMIEGHAYVDQDMDVYICNPFDQIIAFSLCGKFVVFVSDKRDRFREVSLEITVDENV